jgi:hypothetical protein
VSALPDGFIMDQPAADEQQPQPLRFTVRPEGVSDPAPTAPVDHTPTLPPGFTLDFNDRFAGQGLAAPKSAPALAAGLQTAADKKLRPGDAGDATETAIENFANTLMLNAPRNVEAFFKSRDSGRPFSQEYEDLKAREEAGNRVNPKSAIAGTVGGIAAGVVALPGIGGGATMAARAGRAAATGAGYAGVSEALDSKDPLRAGIAASLGAALGGISAPVAEKIVGLVSNLVKQGKTATTFLKPDGTLTDEAVEAARGAGIDPGLFGAVLHRKFAERFAEKGATPATAREAAAGEFNVPLSKGQATQDLDAIRFEDMAGRGAYGKPAQDVANEFQTGQRQAIQSAGRDVGEKLAGDRVVTETPHTAASTVNAEVGANAARGRDVVTRAEDAATREAQASRQMIDDQGNVITGVASGGRAPLSRPQDAGEVVGDAVRDRAARAQAGYRSAYDDALSREGEFSDVAFHDIGERIRREALKGDSPVVISDRTTPIAASAIQHLDNNIGRFRVQDRAEPRSRQARTAGEVQFPGEPARVGGSVAERDVPVALNMRGINQTRKELTSFYKAARASGNEEDQRAVRRIIAGFDDELETAIATGLFRGDETALPALREARAAYANYQRTFRPQGAGDDVGAAMRRIIERNATPEEIANMLYGSSRTGSTGLSSRLAQRLEDTLGRDSDAWSAVRQAAWMRVSQPRTQGGDVDPAKAAANILDFTDGAGRSLAQRLFTREELGAMRQHATGIRQLDQTIEQGPAAQAARTAREGYQEIFGGESIGGSQQQVFRRIVSGEATPEETANAVFNAISGNPGNASRFIQAVERITGRDSDSFGAIRQGVWQKLTQAAEGKDQPGAQKVSQSLNEFLNGKGRTIAERLYSPEELGQMRRYAQTLKMTVIPPNARTNSDTAPALLAALNKYGGVIGSMLGVAADGATGGLAGYAVSSLLKKGFGAASDKAAASKAAESFAGAPVTAAERAARARGPASGLAGAQGESALLGPPEKKRQAR